MSEYFEMRTLNENRGDFDEIVDSLDLYDSGGNFVVKQDEPNGNVPGVNHAHHAAQQGHGSSGLSGWFGWRRQSAGGSKSASRLIPRQSSYSSVPSDDSAYIEPFPFEDFDSDTDSEIDEEDYVFENGEEIGLGQGHDFRPAQLMNMVTWCDKCGELIWGFYKQCLRCSCK